MFSFKNLVAVGLFVFGTTFLWLTRDFLANPREGTGALWSVIQVVVIASILGFAAASGHSDLVNAGGDTIRIERRGVLQVGVLRRCIRE